MRKLCILDLFSGPGSVSETLKRKLGSNVGVLVHSVDIHPKYNPTTQVNILRWNYKHALRDFLRSRRPCDVFIAHASPPCTEYSRAKTRAPRNLRVADAIAKRTLRIIKYAKPDFWTLENPTGLLRNRLFMQPLRKYRKTCSYCRYGKPFRKMTDIWTNVDCELKICSSATPCRVKRETGRHLITAQSGPSGGMEGSGAGENVYSLPRGLVLHVYGGAIE